MRTGLRVGQLRDFASFETTLRETATGLESLYGFDVGVESLVDQYKMYADKLINEHDMIIDGVHYMNDAYNNGKNIITEGANAAMLDMDYGTYPFVTSSSTTIGGICSGLGLSPDKIECAMGVIKAYTTRVCIYTFIPQASDCVLNQVGWGPFPTELTDSSCGGDFPDGAPGSEIGRHLQEVSVLPSLHRLNASADLCQTASVSQPNFHSGCVTFQSFHSASLIRCLSLSSSLCYPRSLSVAQLW